MAFDESYIKRIVEDTVYKMLTENNQLVMEMAMPRKSFKERLASLLPQIIENWCLIRYCSYYQTDNPNIQHWKIELRAHLVTICRTKIDNGNRIPVRVKVFEEVVKEDEFDDPEMIMYTVSTKFSEENLSYKGERFDTIVNEFVEELYLLKSIVANGTVDGIINYVNNI